MRAILIGLKHRPSPLDAARLDDEDAVRILRVKEVANRVGGSVSLVWKLAAEDPDFPKPVRVTPGITGFVEDEVDAFITAKIDQSRQAPAKRISTAIAAEKSAASRRKRLLEAGDGLTCAKNSNAAAEIAR